MAPRIELTQGKYALIDEIDSDLGKLKWYADDIGRRTQPSWYAARNYKNSDGKRRIIRLHRVVVERIIGRPLMIGEQVDHINQDGLDNRRSNLRIANRTQNNANERTQAVPKSSKYKGVIWSKHNSKWMARIRFEGEDKYLGYYDQEDDAARAYDTAAKEIFSSFCSLNFSNGGV
jgi:hypothetical protein